MKKYTYIDILILSLFTVGCSTSILKIDSEPTGADVYVSQANRPAIKVGQTPLNIEESKLANGVEPFQVTISRDGYLNEHVLVPSSTLSRNTSITVRLKNDLSKISQSSEQLDKVASATALTQHLIRMKELDKAEQNLITISNQFPSVATFQELLGNVYYLKRDFTKALKAYESASNLNPKNNETQSMIEKLQGFKKEKQ